MKWLGCAAFAVLLAVPSTARAGELRLSIANGRVTLVAQDVTIKQILDEWSRIGQTTIVGAERVIGPPVTLEFTDVAEGRALETLLRGASGYIAKPRSGTTGASTYDRILIMPASKAPTVSAAPAPFQNRPQPQVVMPNIVDDDNEPNPIMPPGAALPQPPQPFPGQPPMQPGQQQPTLTRPGQLPTPPPIPGNPYQPPYQLPPGATRPPGVPGSGGGPGGGPGGGVR
jgi:hypothetical protein